MPETTATDLTPKHNCKFQYAGHYRPGHQYSPVHHQLDAALKHFYSKTNVGTVLIKKGLLDFKNLDLLDHATVDVWASVVWVKIPKWVPSPDMAMFQKAPQHFCRFISKKDFLEAVIDYAMLQGNQVSAHRSPSNPATMLVPSSKKTGEVYQLNLTKHLIECNCSAYLGLKRSLTEDYHLRGLINAHPILKGQLPDKHVFSVWAAWGIENMKQYQHEYGRKTLSKLGLSLDCIIPGHYTVYHKSMQDFGAPKQTRILNPSCNCSERKLPPKTLRRKLGTVDRKFDNLGRSFWINQRQLTIWQQAPGDRKEYETMEEAALALARLLKIIDDGEKAKADLFGGGWDQEHAALQPAPQHLIEPHENFIDDINQEALDLPTASTKPKKSHCDPFGGFNF